MNSCSKRETIKMQFTTQNMSQEFCPLDSTWADCVSHKYYTHSNECGPRTLLALTIMALHPTPHQLMLLPYMHPNIVQISRWWVANTIQCDSLHIPSISMYFHHNVSVPSLLQMEASHLDLASLDNTYPELSSEVITEVSIHPVKQDNQRISSEFSTQNHQD